MTARRSELLHELILPTLLFAALGGMTWAVRGSSGFGAVKGCVFAGVAWGAAWWFLSIEPGRRQTRRYSSGWIILALTVGIGISGARGWMQWPSFFDGVLLTNHAKGEAVPISRVYGFIWLFIAGVPWAGLGACILAWCGSGRPLRAWEWALRIGCGFGMAYLLGTVLFDHFPSAFLPMYDSLKERYQDLQANPNLRRLIGDNHLAMQHLGCYLGFLMFEAFRRDWKNVKLILTVGILNGIGWSACQNWKWAPGLWPHANVNWWRCWESSGGISIGIAYGIAFYLVNRRTPKERAFLETGLPPRHSGFDWLAAYLMLLAIFSLLMAGELRGWSGWFVKGEYRGWYGYLYIGMLAVFGITYYILNLRQPLKAPTGAAEMHGFEDPNLDHLGACLGLLLGLGLSIKNGLRGWANIYPKMFPEGENYWGEVFWRVIGPLMLACLAVLLVRHLRPSHLRAAQGTKASLFQHPLWPIGLVLIVQNVIAQMITGPLSNPRELQFNIYYLILFLISASIVLYYHFVRKSQVQRETKEQGARQLLRPSQNLRVSA